MLYTGVMSIFFMWLSFAYLVNDYKNKRVPKKTLIVIGISYAICTILTIFITGNSIK